MRTFRTLAVTIALLALASAAPAQKVDLSKMSCKQFVESGKDGYLVIWAWLYGYYADQDAEPVVDVADLTAMGQKLVAFCMTNPTIDLITAAEPIYEKK